MENKLHRFFAKNSIVPTELMYILRSGRKTAFHLLDGRVVENYMHLKDLVAVLPEEDFLRINKSIIVAKRHIASIQQGIYTMSDGRELEGRVRTPGAHSSVMQELEHIHTPQLQTAPAPEDIPGLFAVMDNLPIPFCVVEVAIDEANPGVNLIFRYGNEAMAQHEKRPIHSIIGHSLFDPFPTQVSAKWLPIHSDVALNGNTHIIPDYDEKLNAHYTVYCYQPFPGYSACLLLDHKHFK